MTFKSLGLTVMGLSPGSTFYPVALSELFLLYTGFIDPANQSRSTFQAPTVRQTLSQVQWVTGSDIDMVPVCNALEGPANKHLQ